MAETKYIGNYRIKYKGEILTVPVDIYGMIYLPDGKSIKLTPEQFATVKQKLEERRLREEAEQEARKKAEEEKAEAEAKAKAAKYREENPEAVAKTREELSAFIERIDSKKAYTEPSKQEVAPVVTETPKPQKSEKIAAEEFDDSDYDDDDDDDFEEERSKRKNKKKNSNKLVITITALVTALVMLVLIMAIFFYLVSTGFITVNGTLRLNGLVIYEGGETMSQLFALKIF